MSYAASRAFDLVPRKNLKQEKPNKVAAAMFVLNSQPGVTNKLSEITQSYKEAKQEQIEFKNVVTNHLEKVHKSKVGTPEAGFNLIEDEEITAGIFEFGASIITGVVSLTSAILSPILAFAWGILVSVFEVATTVLVDFIIAPLVTGAVALAVANPITAAILGVAGVGSLAYWAYTRFWPKPPATTPNLPLLGDPEDATINRINEANVSYTPQALASNSMRPTPLPSQLAMPEFIRPMELVNNGTVDLKAANRKLGYRTKDVKTAIDEAAASVGLDPAILTAFAGVESTFNPDAAAPTTSAKGLFQFLDKTWTQTVTRYGKRYGVPANADKFDPKYSALIGAAYLKHEIYPSITKAIGRSPTAQDLYFGHFLGPSGGASFLRNLKDTPNGFPAMGPFKDQAAKNKWVFYHADITKVKDKKGKLHSVKSTGSAKTYSEIYNDTGGSIRDLSLALQGEYHPNTTVETAKVSGKGYTLPAEAANDKSAEPPATPILPKVASNDSSQNTSLVRNPAGGLVKVKIGGVTNG